MRRQGGEGKGPEPLLHVDHRLGLVKELISGEIKGLTKIFVNTLSFLTFNNP